MADGHVTGVCVCLCYLVPELEEGGRGPWPPQWLRWGELGPANIHALKKCVRSTESFGCCCIIKKDALTS